jgi:hypothetical protein
MTKEKSDKFVFAPIPKIDLRELEKSLEANRKERLDFLMFSPNAIDKPRKR